MLQISHLFIYPVKSLGGIEVATAKVEEKGLQYDRRWMLVNKDNRFLTQREHAKLALFSTAMDDRHLIVDHPASSGVLRVPLQSESKEFFEATIWKDTCRVQAVNPEADEWFSQALGADTRLAHLPVATQRQADKKHAPFYQNTSFSDDYPILLVGQASLDDLNARLADPVSINRFRPNIVFTGGQPYCEDELKQFKIGDIQFFGVTPCARCTVITIDQANAVKTPEPLRTLATYRAWNKKVHFGQNIMHQGSGEIKVGDELAIPRPSLQTLTSSHRAG